MASLLVTPGGMLGVLTSHDEGGPTCRQDTTVGRSLDGFVALTDRAKASPATTDSSPR
jgi:hypothetical protein